MNGKQRSGFLITTNKVVTRVPLPEKSSNKKLNDLIRAGKDGGYLHMLFCDGESDRTLFLLSDSYNDIPRGPAPEINKWILDVSGVTIYGDVLVYLSQPQDNDPAADDDIFDLKITLEELVFLLELAGKESPSRKESDKKRLRLGKKPKKREFVQHLLKTDYQNKELRSKWLNILSRMNINNKYPSDSEESE